MSHRRIPHRARPRNIQRKEAAQRTVGDKIAIVQTAGEELTG
jgi:hypothetical protein